MTSTPNLGPTRRSIADIADITDEWLTAALIAQATLADHDLSTHLPRR